MMEALALRNPEAILDSYSLEGNEARKLVEFFKTKTKNPFEIRRKRLARFGGLIFVAGEANDFDREPHEENPWIGIARNGTSRIDIYLAESRHSFFNTVGDTTQIINGLGEDTIFHRVTLPPFFDVSSKFGEWTYAKIGEVKELFKAVQP